MEAIKFRQVKESSSAKHETREESEEKIDRVMDT